MAKADEKVNKQGKKYKYEMKPLFEERMRKLIQGKEDFEEYEKIIHQRPLRWIRCNTLKISSDELLERLRKNWNVSRPFEEWGEIMLVEGKKDGKALEPGELGNSVEHLLGYFYVQEVSSMLPPIALNPQPGDFVLDLTAAPGSKTTQMAAMMNNEGTIIANDIKLDRVKILSANLERCGVLNCLITRNDGVGLCSRLAQKGFKFDKILLDAPCSGEGTLRSSPKTFKMWNPKVVKNMGRQQKKLLAFALKCLKEGGEIVYSTCTHAPEENEDVVNFALENFPVEIDKIKLPLRCRQGVLEWGGKEFRKEIEQVCRIYPHDNNSEGFFVSKMRLLKEVE